MCYRTVLIRDATQFLFQISNTWTRPRKLAKKTSRRVTVTSTKKISITRWWDCEEDDHWWIRWMGMKLLEIRETITLLSKMRKSNRNFWVFGKCIPIPPIHQSRYVSAQTIAAFEEKKISVSEGIFTRGNRFEKCIVRLISKHGGERPFEQPRSDRPKTER